MAVSLADLELAPIHSPALNKLTTDDQAVHRWYRFVLSFPPHLVREYLTKFEVSSTDTVLDPFCGTGTTLVECKKLGIGSVGIEAAPMAAFASATKTNWNVDPEAFVRDSRAVMDECQLELNLSKERKSLFGFRSLDEEAESLLLKGSVSPRPLHKTLALLAQIGAHGPYAPLQRLAMAWSLVNGVGNLKFGPEVGITKPKEDPDVLGLWWQQIERVARDLQEVKSNKCVPSRVHHADSRSAHKQLEPQSIDALITSPPYPNEKDYTRTTRLESVLLGLITTKAELRATKKTLVRSNTRSVYVDDMDHLLVASFPEIQRVAAQIEERRLELGKTSGFERLYHRVTKLYFGGMKMHLESLKPALKPGARLAYVVGDQASYLRVMIRTGQLLAQIAEDSGYEVESIDLFRTRIATATKEQLREEVVVLRWPG